MKSKRSTLLLILLAGGLLGAAVFWGGHPAGTGPVQRGRIGEAPPGVRFVSVALGGFRGLLADILWVRAANLQVEGRFFEVAQLSDWITQLEPRYPEVWAYHAWNLAYNITAVVPEPADRWHWIQNGIRLLRDEGIPANAANPRLYWELGWMYYDKVGGRWDESALNYRMALAEEMSRRLGGGIVDYPEIERQEKVLVALSAVGLKLEVMKALDSVYGPLDWRLPETHAMYWGYRGQTLSPVSKDALWCERLVWMALTETIKGGALIDVPDPQRYQYAPRLDIALKAVRLCVDSKSSKDPLVGLAIMTFLREATLYLYVFQHPAEAGMAFHQLKKMQAPGVTEDLSLEAFIHQDVAARVDGLGKAGGERLVLDQLVRSESWRREGLQVYSDGYERFARLYWTALTGTNGTEQAWQSLSQVARERSLR